ncbi:MAG: ubiquinol-cytochrome C chaperone family protein [Rhodospirillales bacterium]
MPDSVDGRFDLLALHAFLVMRRLKSEPGVGAAFSQALFDLMFEDMDRNLREMGAGDLGVGRRVKAMAKAFYGRVAAYDAGLASGPRVLAVALRRNLYRDAPGVEEYAAAMAAYAAHAAAILDGLPADRVMAGEFAFPPPPAAKR